MTETAPPDGSRVVVNYTGPAENPEPDVFVTLPGYLGALPSIVKIGDDFTVGVEHAEELDGQPEFELVDLLAIDDPTFADRVREIAGDAVVEPAKPADLVKLDEKRAEQGKATTVVQPDDEAEKARAAEAERAAEHERREAEAAAKLAEQGKGQQA